ncbi:MAG TPA: hypothetical protein VEC12_11355 [Bacteroidia bacterium]|nr:hypothetical protein [Bacteroidia bacterium]
MCIIIDTNTLASVFQENSVNHLQFKPVKKWVIEGKGKIIFGGTKYISELKGKYLTFFLQLKKAGKAILVDSKLVDSEEALAEKSISHPDFDDQHLIGLLRISKCKLICSSDSRAYPFFRHNIFFTPASNKPRIYSSAPNAGLLCDRNIADICKPCAPTTNLQKTLLGIK